MAFKLIIFVLFTFSQKSFSAACCGGGASLPNLIIGDYKAQTSLNYSNAAVTHTVDNNGDFIARDKNNREVKETMTLKGSYLLSQLWQIGFEIPFVNNTHETESKSENSKDIGDLKLQVAYEFLPEYSYSYWKPRGFVFLQQNIINSKSVYEVEDEKSTDAIGTGFNSTALGFSFVKAYKEFDFAFMVSESFSQAREFQETRVGSGRSTNTLIGAGFSPKNGKMRFGMNYIYNHDSAKSISGKGGNSSSKFFHAISLNLSYMRQNNSYLISYLDQSFLGRAKNINTSKTLTLSFTHHFDL